MVTDHPPSVGEGPHSGDPHFDPSPEKDRKIGPGSFVLIDLWAKLDKPRAVYSDLTRVGYVGEKVPDVHAKVFGIVAAARDAGIKSVKDAFAADRKLLGAEVDDATRAVIDAAGYG